MKKITNVLHSHKGGVLCNLQRDTNQLDSNKYPVNY